MCSNNKFTILLVLILIIAAGFLLLFLKERKEVIISGTNTTQVVIEEGSPRADAINNFEERNDNARSIAIDDYHHSVRSYRASNSADEAPNFDYFPENRSGVIVFREGQYYWETSEAITEVDSFEFMDITGDNQAELIVRDNGGSKAYGCILYIYTYRDGIFELISPAEEIQDFKGRGSYVLSQVEGCVALDGEHSLRDVDNDGINEIVNFTESITTEKGQIDTKKITRRTYKYLDGFFSLVAEEIIDKFD